MNIPYKRTEPKKLDDVASDMNVTKQYISQIVKSGLGNLYFGMKRKCPDLTPFEIVESLRAFFGCDCSEDVERFFNQFPNKVKNEVKESLIKLNKRSK
ncbi:MAG: hypothetical protein RBS24_07080 [Bacilli bacterium]|nr:hypothetical protein [Bacilli bacterium]